MKRLRSLVANKHISVNLVKLLKKIDPSSAAPNSVGKNSVAPNATTKNDAAKTVLIKQCYQTKTTTARQQLGTITASLTYDIAWLLAF